MLVNKLITIFATLGRQTIHQLIGALNRKATVNAIPLLWLVVFCLLPFLIVLRISFSSAIVAAPPYTPILDFSTGWPQLKITFDNYRLLFSDALYYLAYLNSLVIAVAVTLLCLLIGFPMAYVIARASTKTRIILLLMIFLPFWTSFLLRIYAWLGILNDNGLVNQLLLWLKLTDAPIRLRGTYFSLLLGMVYAYLPLMIMPLYVRLVRLPGDLLDSATDLGCRGWQVVLFVILPFSRGAILAGCMLVLIPTLGEFVIPTLLGSSDILMVGRVLWDEFFANRDWPVAAAIATCLLVILLVPIIFLRRINYNQ